MDSRIKRAKMIDQFMTIVFYGIALFFFLLLVGFAGKVIIGGSVSYTHLRAHET